MVECDLEFLVISLSTPFLLDVLSLDRLEVCLLFWAASFPFVTRMSCLTVQPTSALG